MPSPCACTTIRRANRALFRFYEAALEGCALTITQFSILRALDRNGPTALSQLAEELVMERTSLYRTIAPLEGAGAVAIAASGSGRAKVARLTKKGAAMMAQAEPSWARAQSEVVGLIGEARWRDLSAALLAIPGMLETAR